MLGDNVHSVITDFETRTDDAKFLSTELNRYSVAENGLCAIALARFGSTTTNQLTLRDRDGKVLFDITLDEYISSVSCSGKYVCVLTGDNIVAYNKRGETVGSAKADADCSAIYSDDNYVYSYSLDEINRRFVLGDNKDETAATTLEPETVETKP